MSQILSVNEQLDRAQQYFTRSATPNKLLRADAAPQGNENVPAMFQANKDTTGAVMQFNGTLPDTVTDAQRSLFAGVLKDQQFFLQSGIGLVTAYMTHQFQRDPKSWANPTNWQAPLSVLPSEFYTPTEITQYKFQETMKGVEVATSFIKTMVGWASGAGIASAFSNFLGTIGQQISAGVQSEQTSMDTYNVSFSYQPVLDSAGNWQLISKAEYYFISFNESNKKVYSTCASVEMYDFEFNYQKGTLLLNWANLNSDVNQTARKDFKDVIGASAVDDVAKAKNFFGAKVNSK